ncbi:MAG TPA: response regulator [Stenomitos sp.]
MKILLVEDDGINASLLAEVLSLHHYTVDTVADGQTGLELAQAYNYDLILLDIILPKLDGMTLCRQLRDQGHQMPILLLSGKDSSRDRIMGLEAGADDYVVKPYDLAELVARIRALLRRSSSTIPTILSWEQLQFDPEASIVTYQGKLLHLTPKEYGLLELFLRNPQRIFSRSVILDRIWPSGEFPGEEAVTTQIKGLRQKLKAAGMTTNLIETVYGLGYRLRQPLEDNTQNELRHWGEESKAELNVESSTLQPTTQPDRETEQQPNPSPTQPSSAEAKVMAIVAGMWHKFQASLTEPIALFEEVIAALATGTLDRELQHQATAQAHKIIGSLGTFGLPEGSKLSREIEQLLTTAIYRQDASSTTSAMAERLEELVGLLKQTIKNGPSIQTVTPPVVLACPARLLVIDDDTVLTERLRVEAITWGFQVDVATNLAQARRAIALNPPDVILLDLTFPDTEENGLMLLAQLRHQNCKIPVLVFTAHNQLQDRVEAARLGASTFLHKPIPPTEIVTAVRMVLHQNSSVEAKVMVVDDDPLVLANLQALLSSWGLQVTTLQDSQRFWDVLEATIPDLLILDVAMPGYSGMELCQVVRNDSRWSHLPILLLSAHTDAQMIHQGFTVGADDYVQKPITERELIDRIFSRLERRKI